MSIIKPTDTPKFADIFGDIKPISLADMFNNSTPRRQIVEWKYEEDTRPLRIRIGMFFADKILCLIDDLFRDRLLKFYFENRLKDYPIYADEDPTFQG